MKKFLVYLCMAGVLMGISSCSSSKNAATLSSINGEWDVVEINGEVVVPAPEQEFPFIAFNTAEGTIYGTTGCNRLTGSFDVKAAPGTIDLSGMGSTRMMCPDMTIEDNLLAAMAVVKKYKVLDDENIALCGDSGKPVIVLQKRAKEKNN